MAKTWVLTGSLDNFRATREHGFKLIGAKEKRRGMAEQIAPGDEIVFYVTGVQAFGGAPRESIVYLNHPVRFDTRVATEALARNGLRCPRLEEYVGPLVRFYRDHEDDPAFAPAD